MNVDLDGDISMHDEDNENPLTPMPPAQGISHLRDKLHAKMATLRRGWHPSEPGDKDGLLEERRRQRAALREKRRKETKEKKRKEEESRKSKGKKKEENAKGNLTKVSQCSYHSFLHISSVFYSDAAACPRPSSFRARPIFIVLNQRCIWHISRIYLQLV